MPGIILPARIGHERSLGSDRLEQSPDDGLRTAHHPAQRADPGVNHEHCVLSDAQATEVSDQFRPGDRALALDDVPVRHDDMLPADPCPDRRPDRDEPLLVAPVTWIRWAAWCSSPGGSEPRAPDLRPDNRCDDGGWAAFLRVPKRRSRCLCSRARNGWISTWNGSTRALSTRRRRRRGRVTSATSSSRNPTRAWATRYGPGWTCGMGSAGAPSTGSG